MSDCTTCRQALTYDACVEIREAVELAEQLGADREHLRATLREALARLGEPSANIIAHEPTDRDLLALHLPSVRCPSCDANPNNACFVWPAYGKLYRGCELRMAARGGEAVCS